MGESTAEHIDAILKEARRANRAETARWLARRAMALDERLPEPHTILGEWEDNPSAAEAHYRKAMELAWRQKESGKGSADESRGSAVYPAGYLSAVEGLVGALARGGRTIELIDYGREALSLDPEDKFGLRNDLLGPLIEYGHYDEADELLERFAARERDSAARLSNFVHTDRDSTAYARALLAFARAGETEQARSHLARALATSLRSESYLLGEESIPALTHEYLMTDESDAAIVASRVLGAFRAVEGATNWLGRECPYLLHARVFFAETPGAAPGAKAVQFALRGMVREMASEIGLSTDQSNAEDGTPVLAVSGYLADIRRLILNVFYEGFSGFHVEVERPEMLAAMEHLYPKGLSASARDDAPISYLL